MEVPVTIEPLPKTILWEVSYWRLGGLLGTSWRAFCGLFGASLGFLEASYGRLGGLLGTSWRAFWGLFGASLGLFGPPGGSRSVLGRLEEPLRVKGTQKAPQGLPKNPPRTPQELPLGAPFRADSCPRAPPTGNRERVERRTNDFLKICTAPRREPHFGH